MLIQEQDLAGSQLHLFTSVLVRKKKSSQSQVCLHIQNTSSSNSSSWPMRKLSKTLYSGVRLRIGLLSSKQSK